MYLKIYVKIPWLNFTEQISTQNTLHLRLFQSLAVLSCAYLSLGKFLTQKFEVNSCPYRVLNKTIDRPLDVQPCILFRPLYGLPRVKHVKDTALHILYVALYIG